jgi:hypothetical protein
MSHPEITLAPHEYRRLNDRPSRPVGPSMSAGRRALCAAFGALLLWASVSLGWPMLVSGHIYGAFVLCSVTWGAMGALLVSTALWPNGPQTRV